MNGAASIDFTFGPYCAPVRTNHPADNGQTQAKTSKPPRARPIDLIEGLKNLAQLLRRNADPLIPEDEMDVSRFRVRLDRDPTPARAKFHGVVKNVEADLPYLLTIALQT